jgi:hypothetical protein
MCSTRYTPTLARPPPKVNIDRVFARRSVPPGKGISPPAPGGLGISQRSGPSLAAFHASTPLVYFTGTPSCNSKGIGEVMPAVKVEEKEKPPKPEPTDTPQYREIIVRRGVDFVSYWLRVF